MINNWEELGELLSEWENRMSNLENSIPRYEAQPIQKPVEYSNNKLNEVKAMLLQVQSIALKAEASANQTENSLKYHINTHIKRKNKYIYNSDKRKVAL